MRERRSQVTPEIVAHASKARVLGLVLPLVAVLLCTNIIASMVLRAQPVNRSNWLVQEKWRLLDRHGSAETLVLGDSSCSQGVRPDVLDPALGTRSLNLCTVGNMLAINDVWMLGEYVRLHGRPMRVIIIHVYNAWSRTIDEPFAQLLGKIERPWNFWSKLEPSVDLDLDLEKEVAISRWLPIYGENTSLARLLGSPILGRPPRFELDRSSGFMAVNTARPARVRKDAANHLAELSVQATSGLPVLSEANARALVSLARLAEREQLDVFIVPAPIYRGLWSDVRTQKRFDAATEAVRSAVASSPRVRVLGGPPCTFAETEMENVDHVVGPATGVYTRWLVDQLTRAR